MTNAAIDVDRTAREQREKRVAQVGNGTAPHGSFSRRREKGRDRQRWATLNTFVDAVLANASESEVRVWLVIYRDVKPGGLARVGMTDIARRAGLTRRAVVNAINGLKARRLIEVVTRGSINGTPNAYRLLNPGAL